MSDIEPNELIEQMFYYVSPDFRIRKISWLGIFTLTLRNDSDF